MRHTYAEITRQPSDWAETLRAVNTMEEKIQSFFLIGAFSSVTFTGCGTSYYLAMSAACLFQEETGIPSRALPASELMTGLNRVLVRTGRELLVAISRSGSTTETVEALKNFADGGYGNTLSISCKAGSSAGDEADLALELPHVTEESMVMTSSFTNMLLAAQLLSTFVSGNSERRKAFGRLPELGDAVLVTSEKLARSVGSDLDIQQFIYLGLSAYNGVANEAVLKLKEMTQTSTEAYNPFEFRHGPISVVNSQTMTVLLANDSASAKQAEVLKDIRKLGGKTLFVGDGTSFDTHADESLLFGTGLRDSERIILYLPLVQLIGYFRALSLQLNPDQPRYLNPVVFLKV